MTTLYHYTNGLKIRSIISDGVINGNPKNPKPREKRVVWLSSNSIWEKTANKIIELNPGETKLLNKNETEFYCKGLFRFVFISSLLDVNAIAWPRLSVEAKIPPVIKKRLVKRAKNAGVSPEQWHGVIGDLSVKGLKIEKFINGNWIEIEASEAIPNENGYNIGSRTALKGDVSDNDWKKI